jgi:hypothetical protein
VVAVAEVKSILKAAGDQYVNKHKDYHEKAVKDETVGAH